MAIFPRSTLQRLIDGNSAFLTRKQLRKHVDGLNNADEHSLGIEWEVVLLNVFSKLGGVTHEPKLGKRPDLHFIAHGSKSQEFIADIATVSDRGVDDRFPIQALSIKLSDIVYKRGLRNGAFSLRVGWEVENNIWPRPNPRLKIPHRNLLDRDVFNERFFQFLDAVSVAPEESRYHSITSTTPSVDILITYDPKQQRSSTSWPGYNELKSLTQNTVYSRLEDKAAQLASARYQGYRAVIVCDGGCNLLSSQPCYYEKHVGDVIRYFFRMHPEITFVLTFIVEETFGFNAQRNVIATLYMGKPFAHLESAFWGIFEGMKPYFPEAERSARNAGHLLEWQRARKGKRLTENEVNPNAAFRIPS